MRKIEIGDAELRVVMKILEARASNLPTPHLNAKDRSRLDTFLVRLKHAEPAL